MKARTRVDRWAQEKVLLQEEIRRVLRFFEWRSSWWLDQRHRRKDEHASVLRELAAYAEKQAAVYNRLAAKFAGMWLPFLELQGIRPDWTSRYTEVDNPTSDRGSSQAVMPVGYSEDSDSE